MQQILTIHDETYNVFNLKQCLISRQNLHQMRATEFGERREIVGA
jgi:hypothetical protein